MSGAPSEPRSSLSSDPSATSSYTLNSRNSAHYVENGEGSSTPNRSSMVSGRSDASAGNSTQTSNTAHSGSPLGRDYIGEQDFAHRRHRSRKSGGFLLDSAFLTAPRSKAPTARGHTGEGDDRGKHRARDSRSSDTFHRLRHDNAGSHRSSPLSHQVDLDGQDNETGHEQTSRLEGHDGNLESLRVGKTRRDGRRPQSGETEQESGPAKPVIDPNQIVNMALNLSESRRRNLSASQILIPPPSSSKRVTSIGAPPSGSYQNYSAGSSLRQYLQQQRRASRNISPGTGRNSPAASRHASAAMSRSISGASMGQVPVFGYTFTDATLARRDKARDYIELYVEYLRLLEFLPPLKPDATAPGNFLVTASNVPGSPHAELTRIPSYANSKYNLGRAYDPLQFIRNRRSRARERKALDHEAQEFQDVNKVREWVDVVQKESRRSGYRGKDKVALPRYHDEHDQRDSGPSKPPRPRMGWVIAPSELLADAYWLEQDDNKSIVEDRFGRKIFTPKQYADHLQPRSSKEFPEKRRRSWIDLPGATSESVAGDESEASERGRKRRLLPAFRGSRPYSRSHSGPSGSENESDQPVRKPRKPRRTKAHIDHDNYGPLELHLKTMLHKETEHADTTSPIVDSPDKWGGAYTITLDEQMSADISKSKDEPDGHPRALDTNEKKPRLKKRQTELVLSPESIHAPRSSFEDLDSTGPNTPVIPSFFPSIGADLSPPTSRGPSRARKPKRSKLDVFRSDGSVRAPSSEPESTIDDHKRNSRHTSGEHDENNGMNTTVLAAPGGMKSLLTHRKNESVSSLGSPDKGFRKDHKEPSSAVTRFLKGGSRFGERVKNEGSKVGEFIFRRDRPADDSDTSSTISDQGLSDSETDEGKLKRKPRPKAIRRTTTAGTTDSVTLKNNGRSHFELPSFRSSKGSQYPNSTLLQVDSLNQASGTDSDHPITRQARARANSRSARFDKLAPPRMDLTRISTASSASPSRSSSPTAERDRLNAVLRHPGRVGRGGLPYTPLAHPDDSASPHRHRSTSRPKLEKRHWSITDSTAPRRSEPSTTTVTKADVARIRALLLCSGVKAREIARRAATERPHRSQFLTQAAETAGANLIPVSRKEEHVLAARILTRFLESSTQALHDSAARFRNSTCQELQSRIDALKDKLEDEVFPRVRKSGDEAMHIASEVAGAAPLMVKNVSDEIDAMFRARRRKMRWVRRVGWTMLEWALLVIMWWVWFVVMLIRMVKGIVSSVLGAIRWFLWI